ncbi:MAG: hypothetical protein C5B52_01265 [Bacteroidetes bacterium]|nr:MAG: hypothetical protein C5B52_01265 [Bacteroidota bacterium]
MKTLIIFSAMVSLTTIQLKSQTSKTDYPEPEFKNEVYFFNKGESKLVRLEKSLSKLETKTKAVGMGGYESGYTISGTKATSRIPESPNLYFIFSNGSSAPASNKQNDSTMRANGIDQSMQNSMNSMFDPTNSLSLYKTDFEKGDRKIFMQKAGGAFSFNHKVQSSDKFTFSMRKIKEGYWELVIDKHLPKGEYAFTIATYGMAGASGETTIYSFGID